MNGDPTYACPVRNGGILSSPRGRLYLFARFARFKRVERATLRAGLRTPSTRTEGPLVRDDAAEAAPVLYPRPRLPRRPSLFRTSLAPCARSPFSFFLCILSAASLLLLSRRGACDQQPGTRRGLRLAPGTGASPLTFRTIRELPVSLLRGVVPKTTPGQ